MRYLAILLLSLSMQAQHNYQDRFNLSVTTDAKVLLFGTDNEYITHRGIGNVMIVFEALDNEYWGWTSAYTAGYEFANLPEQRYNQYFVGYGPVFDLTRKLVFMPSLEGFAIKREFIPADEFDKRKGGYNAGIAITLDIRYKIFDKLYANLRFNAEQATDLPNRLIRWQFTEGLVYSFN